LYDQVRAVKRYIEAGYVEAEILEKLRNADPNREAYVLSNSVVICPASFVSKSFIFLHLFYSHCVRLYGYFEAEHRGTNHLFIIFESLVRFFFQFSFCVVTLFHNIDLFSLVIQGRSLFDVIKRNDYAGFPAEYVRAFAHQLLTAIACMFDLSIQLFLIYFFSFIFF
jgi:hypothetical protein